MLKLLAAADIHMGRRSTHAPDIIAPSRHAWTKLVETALDGQYDLLLLSGDLVDWDNRFFEAIGPLQHGLQQLEKAGIAVCLIAGNHDFKVLAHIMQNTQYQNVFFLGARGNWETKYLMLNDKKVAVTGWSFTARHHDSNPLITFPDTDADADIRIGLVHGDLDIPNSRYAPLTSNELQKKYQHLWLLGHIHKPAARMLGNSHVFYPGSLQALSPKETGLHGAIHIELSDNGTLQTYRWIPISPVRYETLTIDATAAMDVNNLLEITKNRLNAHREGLLQEYTELKHLVIDMEIQVEKKHHKEFWEYLDKLNVEEQLEYGDLTISLKDVRCTGIIMAPDLQSLMLEPSPAGRLASLIYALENNTEMPLKDNLLNKVEATCKNLPGHIFGKALQERSRLGKPIEDERTDIITQMARKLLVSLLESRQN